MLLALVFGAVFLTVLGALSSVTLTQNRVQNVNTGRVKALALAEAGLEYYRWFLAHHPGDLTNGTGAAGPYSIPYSDPEGGVVGTISLEVEGASYCGQPGAIDIRSTGTSEDETHVSRTIRARYSRPTVAQYSYILNDSVWAGDDRVINGPYHSNGGIRMDGTTNAPVTSSLSSWLCTSSFGCAPNQTVNGVFGDGPNSGLWSFPSPQVDFAGISADFSFLKATAQTSGQYVPRYSSGASTDSNYWRGYRLTFNSNGTVTVRRVTATTALNVTPVNSADPLTDRALSGSESAYATYTLPANCGLIFVEDNIWVEGVITGKVTVVAANVTTTGVAPNAYLKGNITYGNTNAGLTVIAEHDVLVVPDSPQNMTLNGVFIAQDGAFGRNRYRSSSSGSCHATYEPRTSLTIHGTTVSNKRTGTKWVNGCSSGDAGYQTRVDAYDRVLATDPPPFTPIVSSDYQFVDWQEE
ncbi:MAG: hypothetical protein QOE22_149 [Candidatus Parcubacteria bacterium]|jgi:hypothetical protein|nr:hypothetical protein [Candidatus Parcubacteria bacterium]